MAIPQNTAHAEESAEVEVLSANLDKLKSLTIKIQSSMDRLDVSGRVIQDALTPIYAYTQSLQTTSDNITKVNDAIDGLRRPLKVVEDEEATIRAGFVLLASVVITWAWFRANEFILSFLDPEWPRRCLRPNPAMGHGK